MIFDLDPGEKCTFDNVIEAAHAVKEILDERHIESCVKTSGKRGLHIYVSVGAKYTIFKRELGIEGLHFHDNRAEAITNWLKKLPPHKVRQFVSGHRGEGAFNRYVRTNSADGHEAVRQAEAERMAA